MKETPIKFEIKMLESGTFRGFYRFHIINGKISKFLLSPDEVKNLTEQLNNRKMVE